MIKRIVELAKGQIAARVLKGELVGFVEEKRE